jgi:phage shock protein A
MGLFARLKAIWYALLNRSVTEMEETHVVALAENKLQLATEKLKEARQGLVGHQALVLKVQQQVESEKSRIRSLTAQVKNHLRAGKDEMAGQLALQLAQLKTDVATDEEQLERHRQSYENNLLRVKAALQDIETAKKELKKKKAELQMEEALAEVSETAGALDSPLDGSNDIGSLLTRVDDQVFKARARTRVASDLGEPGIEELKGKMRADKALASELLQQFKIEQGLSEPSPEPEEKSVEPRRQAGTQGER